MFTVRGNLRTASLCRASSTAALRLECRRPASQLARASLQTSTPLAEQLSETGLWNYGRWSNKKKKRPKGDKNRVNIVSEKLCDDAINYIKPSLQRHIGCDIIDIYPGAGLWSSKLHDVIKPRSHILLEPDESIYKPFLKDLLAKDNTTFLPKSGIIWRDLSSVLDKEYLPHQKERTEKRLDNPPERNDTLLVTANLAFHPKRRFAMFESLAQLVLYQFINSIRASSLFNKYGLVRMLVWVESTDKMPLLARSYQRRRRMAIEAELATESITEVAGPVETSQWFIRDRGLDTASCLQTLDRMAKAGIKMPKNRQSDLVKEALGASSGEAAEASSERGVFDRPWREELDQLESDFQEGLFEKKTDEYRRMMILHHRSQGEKRAANKYQTLLDRRDELAALHEAGKGKTKKVIEQEEQWNAEVHSLAANSRQSFQVQRDNMHLFYQDPPVLMWDRRPYEPLLVQDEEFFPNASCSLLDIQPKTMNSLLRAMGPGTNRSGDIFELLLRAMLTAGGDPVSKAIETVWPGAAEGVLPHCPSLRDRSKGGMPVGGYGELSARLLNETQWLEILEAWMKWPFRPTLPQLVARITEEGASTEAAEDDLGHLDI